MSRSLKINYEYFFDRTKVINAMTRAERNVLVKFGAFVRQTARSSIKDAPIDIEGKQAVSPPGRPPYSHVGLLRQFILFAYEPEAHTVVIGPKLLNRRNPTTPEILEYGGLTTRRGKPVTVRARPFMRPALGRESSRFVGLFYNSVRES